MRYLGQVCKKFSYEPLSEVFELDAPNRWAVADKLEELTGIKIDGTTNYANYVELEQEPV